MIKDEIYFLQEHKQSFIRIKYVDVTCISRWVHFYESVILEDLIELNQLRINNGLIKESYRTLEYMENINSSKATNYKDIQILHKIPDSIINKVNVGNYLDNEVLNFHFLSQSSTGRTYSNPIASLSDYRNYILDKLLTQ